MAAMLKAMETVGTLRVSGAKMAQIFDDCAESNLSLFFSLSLSNSRVACSLTGVHQMLQAAFTVPLHFIQH